MNKEDKFVSAVVYIHNEEKYIKRFIEIINDFLFSKFLRYEIICVDDASTDNSVSEVKNLVKSRGFSNVSLVSMDIFQGREAGMQAGVDLSIGDYVYEIEWVNMFEPDKYGELLWETYVQACKGYDIVSYESDAPRHLKNSVFYHLYNKFNLNYTDLIPESFRLVTRRALNRVSSMDNAIVYRKALYANCGLQSCVIGSKVSAQKNRKMNIKQDKSKLGMNVLLAYTSFVPNIAVIGIILNFFDVVVAFLFGIKTQFEINSVIWISLAIIGLVLSALLMFCLKYLELILHLVLKKQRYIAGSVDKIINCEHQ